MRPKSILLTKEQKQKIRELRSEKKSYEDISLELNVSIFAVANFCRKEGLNKNPLLKD